MTEIGHTPRPVTIVATATTPPGTPREILARKIFSNFP
jgi:hypothetical protein